MYAIIRSGGKQYRVQENRVVRLELLDNEVGSTVELTEVALLGGGTETLIGTPVVEGARVVGRIVAHGRTRRIVVYKYKPKKGYHRRRGHRQHFHDVLIQHILGPGQQARESTSDTRNPDQQAIEETSPVSAEALSI